MAFSALEGGVAEGGLREAGFVVTTFTTLQKSPVELPMCDTLYVWIGEGYVYFGDMRDIASYKWY